mmetsp:Transcript_12460/g.15786  ORF Transcript_12460/g.15786 Transcript_12460/m.15786 type:complete len:770 (-) Transcript_12460:153-2462(-)
MCPSSLTKMKFFNGNIFKIYANISPLVDDDESVRIKSNKSSSKIWVINPITADQSEQKQQVARENSNFKNAVCETEKVLKTFEHKSKTFDPESSYVHTWDSFVLCALIFTALVTPYEVALLTTELNALFFVNRIIDAIFIKDMVMNFFMPYWEQDDIEEAGLWVKDLKKIQSNYLKGWFTIDLISILPFDVIAFFDGSGSFSTLKIVRVIRVLRLLKLVRVLRASRIFKRLENEITLSFSLQSLIKFTMMVLIGGHWLACVWALVGSLEFENLNDNWIAVLFDTNGDDELSESEQETHFTIYTASLYFAIMTISSIGYGDITPISLSERWTCISIMLIGSAVWAYVIGNASGIVATMDIDGINFHQTMDSLNIFLRDQKYPLDLKKKLRSYFRAIRHLMKTRRYQCLVQNMSPKLRDIVAVRGAHWVKKVPWSQGVSSDFVAILVQNMNGSVFAPDEIMPSVNHLCVVNRGVASKQGHVLVKGSSYGMDIILQSTFLKQKTPARALTFVELLVIKRAQFLEILTRFPTDKKLIRRYALALAIRRAMILIHTFSKCGWKFNVGNTQIPFVAPQALNQGVGEKYEKFVRGLHPQLSKSETDEQMNIQELIFKTEKQEHEEGDIAKILGHSTLKSSIEYDHEMIEAELEQLGQKVNHINSQVACYDRAIDALLKELEMQSHSSLNQNEDHQHNAALEESEGKTLDPATHSPTVHTHLNMDSLRGNSNSPVPKSGDRFLKSGRTSLSGSFSWNDENSLATYHLDTKNSTQGSA